METPAAESLPVEIGAIAPREPLGDALARIGRAQFERIRGGLAGHPDRDTGVHEARKGLKRLRALLRMVAHHLEAASFSSDDAALRDLGRAVAPLRDARVMLDTLDEVGALSCPGLRADLERRHAAAGRALDAATLTRLAGEIDTAGLRWAATFPAAVPGALGGVEAGLRRTYGRARKRRRRALERGRGSDFHEWRKEVKHLRYQLEALRLLDEEMLSPRIGLLDGLGEQLGLEHDLTVLIALVEPEDRCDEDLEHLVGLLSGRRDLLRKAALNLGNEVFAAGKSAFVASLASVWGTSGPEQEPLADVQG